MSGLTDADRLAMLRALGAGDVVIGQGPPITALFRTQPLETDFDGIRVNGVRPTLRALTSDVQRLGVKHGDAVEIPGQRAHYIAEIHDDSGMAFIELRQE